MSSGFKRWSQLNTEAKSNLKPDLGLRKWSSLTENEKYQIWKHLEEFFFGFNEKRIYSSYGPDEYYFDFFPPLENEKRNRINYAIDGMTYLFRVRNYAKNYLDNASFFNACMDFKEIFFKCDGDAVLELLSLYCESLLSERLEKEDYYVKQSSSSPQQYEENLKQWRLETFNEFAYRINDVFGDFGIDVVLTTSGFIPKQEEKIIEEIYTPVIKCLSDSKWKPINNLLSDAFAKYRENTPHGYSTCVTHTVAAVEAFLQIVVKGKTGEGDFAALISEGQRKNLIPSDMFTKEIFKNIISVLMRERKETGDAHVKQAYATEKNAKMVLNLSMVFIQHCLLK